MADILFDEFINPERWQREIEIARLKGIPEPLLRKLVDPRYRAYICIQIHEGNYTISPPRQQLIPKDNGKFRTVYINEDLDRIVLSLINNIMMDLCSDWIHPSCMSYQKGIGTGKAVKRVSRWIVNGNDNHVGYKTDLSKYFDSVPIRLIDEIFDKLERQLGKSCIIDLLRKYYHSDWCFELEGNLIQHYQSLKQGCATASFLANVLLEDVDEKMTELCKGQYIRYSDDMLFICEDPDLRLGQLRTMLLDKGLILNPDKVEPVYKDRWVKFLGFSIKGDLITLSKNRLKNFQKEIEKRTIDNRNATLKSARNAVNHYLYKGYGKEGYCWATSILPVINSGRDINELNKFIMDCLKAVETGNKDIGGLGYEHHSSGVITRGKGRNVAANRKKVDKIEGYYTVRCMWKNLNTCRAVYDAVVRQM